MSKDIINSLIQDWKQQKPNWSIESMGIVGRLMVLGNLLTKRTNKRPLHERAKSDQRCYNTIFQKRIK